MSGRRSSRCGGQTRGDLEAHHQLRQGLAPLDGLGVVPQQDAELVFLLADLALQVRDPGAGGVHQGVGLGHVLPGYQAPVVAQHDQASGGLEGFQGGLGDLQLAVQGAQLEVGPGHVGHHGGPHRPLAPIGRPRTRTGRLSSGSCRRPNRSISQKRSKLNWARLSTTLTPGGMGGLTLVLLSFSR